jgi:3-oxoacyl-[acyl-carrier protein] reductase
MDKFDEIKIGAKAEISHVITKEDIRKFVELTGDDNKLHVDEAYAGKTSFKKPVAHGMLGVSFISTIIGTKIPGDGALWFSQNIEFLLPVRINDELTITAEVIKKNEQLRTIEIQTDIYNQHKQKVTTGTAKVKIVEQENVETSAVPEQVLREKTALIIGGTGGIGAATCKKLAKEGFNVAIHYHKNKEVAQKLMQEISAYKIKVCCVSGNITSLKDVNGIIEQAIRKVGSITVFINCSTLKIPNIKFNKLEWEDIQNHIDLHVKSNFYFAQALVPGMKEQKTGKFIFITSQVTDNVPPADWTFYTTAKYALNGFAKSLAVELAPHNIHVNLVSPGMTDTELISDVPEKTKLLLAAKSPLRRLAKPEDIAGAIAFLASDDANYITGETMRVNGGQIML